MASVTNVTFVNYARAPGVAVVRQSSRRSALVGGEGEKQFHGHNGAKMKLQSFCAPGAEVLNCEHTIFY
jgi:hypothetical protein